MTHPANNTPEPHHLAVQLQTELTTLQALLPHVQELLEPARGQHPVLRPKPTDDELDRRRETHQLEREGQLENLRQGIAVLGPAPIPASLEALDVAVRISKLLIDIEQRLWATIRACPLPDHGTDQARLRRLLRDIDLVTNEHQLHAMLTDATAARRAAEHLVDGEPRRRLNARCPYCHNETLVVYQRDPRRSHTHLDDRTPTEVIRCDKPIDQDCVCSSETCPCTNQRLGRYQTYRHTWTRDRGGWETLASLLERHATTCAQCRAS